MRTCVVLLTLTLISIALILNLHSCTQTDLVKLKMYVPPFLGCTSFFIAKEEGYFAEQGLEVEFVNMGGLEKAIPALIQGDLDLAPGDLRVAVLNAIARGGVIKMVADAGSVNSVARMTLVGKKTLVETLDNPENLRGCRIAATKMGVSEYYVEKVLSEVGLTSDDVVMKYDIPVPLRSEALEKGVVDIIATAEPWLTRILRTGNTAIWMPAYEFIPNLQSATIMYGPSLLKDNPDAGRRFMVAYLKSARQFNQGKTPRNLELAARFTGLDMELIAELNWPRLQRDGKINAESVLDFQAWTLGKGYLDHPVTEDQLLDFSFAKYASNILDTP